MKRFFALALALFCTASLSLFAASDYLLKIEGVKGEKIKDQTQSVNGRVSLNGLPPGTPIIRCTVGWEGQDYVLYFDTGIKSPRDAASGLPTGKRMHKPFVILSKGQIFDYDTKEQAVAKAKELDKSSPLLLQLAKQGASLTFQKIEWTK